MKSLRSILLLAIAYCLLPISPIPAATITGNLTDISINPLSTTLLFSPTNDVLLTPSGLNAGPPKAIDTIVGAFSLVLEAGDYTVSLPLIPWRRSFRISVPDSASTINITNLLAAPTTYTYTNDLSCSVKVVRPDASPDFLNNKILVAGSLTKTLVTNSGAVTMVLSNSPFSQVNTSTVVAWSTNTGTSLLFTSPTFPANSLQPGNVITVEAFGSFTDPAANAPDSHFALKLGSTTIVAQSISGQNSNWHLVGCITIRAAGATGSALGNLEITSDQPGNSPLNAQSATIDTTVPLQFKLVAEIDNFTTAESITCYQAFTTLR